MIVVAALLLTGTSAFGTTCQNDICNPEKFTLDSITLTPELGLGTNQLLAHTYAATSCVGVFLGENDDSADLSLPAVNIGQENAGMLNGQGALFDGLEFIGEEDLQDLDGDGNATDPGWIHLAHFDTQTQVISYDTAGPNPYSGSDVTLDIGELLTLSFTTFAGESCAGEDCTEGRWTLTTHVNVIEDAQSLLGEASFDHLAFSVKAGNAFAVYDFDFTTIFEQEGDDSLLDFSTPYELSGTFSLDDFCDHGISHLNIWARDPSDVAVVPEPSTYVLLGLGFVAVGFLSRRRR